MKHHTCPVPKHCSHKNLWLPSPTCMYTGHAMEEARAEASDLKPTGTGPAEVDARGEPVPVVKVRCANTGWMMPPPLRGLANR